MLFSLKGAIGPLLGLSDEISMHPCSSMECQFIIIAAQGAANLSAVKVGGQKNCCLSPCCPAFPNLALMARGSSSIFSQPPALTAYRFAAS